VTCSVIDAAGAESASKTLAQTLPPHGTAEAQLHLVVPQPHRWNGLSDPYLYQAVVELKQNGQLLDRVVQPLGFRTYRLDATDGFILNDHPYPLHGAAVHQDFQDKGWARSPADLALTYQIIGEIGANAVRLAPTSTPTTSTPCATAAAWPSGPRPAW
jgi:beta-galactosidase